MIKRGFTLIELVITVSIIALLAGLVTFNTNKARIKGRDNKRKADMQLVAGALELYYAQNKFYPCSEAWTWDILKTALVPSFISVLPTDPRFPTGGYDSGYVYASEKSCTTTANQFAVDATLENRDEQVTNTTISGGDNTSQLFFQSGTYQPGTGKVHYRVSSQ